MIKAKFMLPNKNLLIQIKRKWLIKSEYESEPAMSLNFALKFAFLLADLICAVVCACSASRAASVSPCASFFAVSKSSRASFFILSKGVWARFVAFNEACVSPFIALVCEEPDAASIRVDFRLKSARPFHRFL